MSIVNRYTRGASRPVMLLLSPPDMAKFRVEHGMWDNVRMEWGQLMFCGVEVKESKWCEQHEPLAVVRDIYS